MLFWPQIVLLLLHFLSQWMAPPFKHSSMSEMGGTPWLFFILISNQSAQFCQCKALSGSWITTHFYNHCSGCVWLITWMRRKVNSDSPPLKAWKSSFSSLARDLEGTGNGWTDDDDGNRAHDRGHWSLKFYFWRQGSCGPWWSVRFLKGWFYSALIISFNF